MSTVVYFKDDAGIVRGPLSIDEAESLRKTGFFHKECQISVVRREGFGDFKTFDDLCKLNGPEAPFTISKYTNNNDENANEVIRLCKELSVALAERDAMQRKMEDWKQILNPKSDHDIQKLFIHLRDKNRLISIVGLPYFNNVLRWTVKNLTGFRMRCFISADGSVASTRPLDILDPREKLIFTECAQSYLIVTPVFHSVFTPPGSQYKIRLADAIIH